MNQPHAEQTDLLYLLKSKEIAFTTDLQADNRITGLVHRLIF